MIEEAAGILKYRRRRERAERRLEATEANLLRLQDLLREVKRQLKPLERQAEAARRHDEMAAELRALQLHLAGRELEELALRSGGIEQALASVAGDEARLSAELVSLDEVVLAGENFLASERTVDVRPALARVEALGERARGLAMLVAERSRSVSAALDATVDAGVVASLESEAARLGDEIALAEQAAATLGPEWEQLGVTEERVAGEARRLRDEQVAAAGPAGTAGTAAGGTATDSSGRPSASPAEAASAARRALSDARERLARSREAGARLVERLSALDRRVSELEEEARRSKASLEEAQLAETVARQDAQRLAADAEAAASAEREADEIRRAAEAAHHAAAGRAEALGSALDEARARAGVERLAGAAGVIGALLDVVEVDAGYEKAFEAAVDEALGAVVVEGVDNARSALDLLCSQDPGGAVLVAMPRVAAEAPVLGGGEALRPHVRSAEPAVNMLLDGLLERVVWCEGGLQAACDLALAMPAAVVVTPAGDRLSATGWRVGGGRLGATRSALEDAVAAAGAASSARSTAADRAEAAAAAAAEVRAAAAAATRLADRKESDVRRHEAILSEVEQQLRSAGEARRLAAEEAERLQAEAEGLGRSVEQRQATVNELEAEEAAHLEHVERERLVAESQRQARQALAERERAVAALRAELEVRAAGLEERRSLLAARLAEVERRLEGHLAARQEAAGRRVALERARRALTGLGVLVGSSLERLSTERQRLVAEEERQSDSYRRAAAQLTASRQRRARLEAEVSARREKAHRLEIEQAEMRLRKETAVASLAHDLDAEPEAAIAAVCPELPEGTSAAARARDLERELRLLGPINPLALEELRALEERSSFVDSQLDDVRSARRELGARHPRRRRRDRRQVRGGVPGRGLTLRGALLDVVPRRDGKAVADRSGQPARDGGRDRGSTGRTKRSPALSPLRR